MIYSPLNSVFHFTDKPFLGFVDKLGTAFSSPIIATGFGAHLATPMLREATDAKNGVKFTEAEAVKLVQKCLEVLFYRDARSWNRYQIAIVDDKGSRIEGPFKIESNWKFADMIQGYE